MKKIFYFFTIIMLIFSSCGGDTPYTYLKGKAQGTTFNIQYFDTNTIDYSDSIANILKNIDKQLSTYDTSSTISKFNRRNPEEIFVINDAEQHFKIMIQQSNEIYYSTNRAFDPTIKPLIDYWGFGEKLQDNNINDSTIKKILKRTGMNKLKYHIQYQDKEQLMLIHPTTKLIQLNLNAIAQGYTVDVLSRFFQKKGIKDYYVELGGEVFCSGKNPKGKIWRTQIDKPIAKGSEQFAVIECTNKAIVTSGNYRKFYEKDGKKYAHTINPLSGYPSQHNLLSATVVCPSATNADAYATAFMVMGVEKAMSFIDEHPELEMDAYFILNDFSTKQSKGFEKYLVK